MSQTPKKRSLELAELISHGVKPPPAVPGAAEQTVRLNRVNPAGQRRMEAKQSGESGANHARHHVSRKTQS